MAFVLHTIGGLCNRIQSILGYRNALYAKGGTLDVLWEPTQAVCFGTWSDVFEPLAGVRISDKRTAYGFGHTCITVDKAPTGAWRGSIHELNPSWEVAGRVSAVLGELPEDFAAIHVRRTDYVECAAAHGVRLTPLDEYVTFAEGASAVYVATDNATTQGQLFAGLPNARIAKAILGGETLQGFGDDRRHTSLVDAAVDLFVCARAARFMGTPGSTFSETIAALRSPRGGS